MNRTTTALAGAGLAIAALAGSPTATADAYGDMFAAVDWLAQKYGVFVYTDHAPMDYGVYGVTSGDVITFNSGYIANPDLLRRDITADVNSGYHPGANCSPEQLVAAHEFAHVLDNLTGRSARAEADYAIANGLTGEVSGYAMTSTGEALAEAFVAVECDVPTPAENALYVMLTT